jgi:hypothetical protein
MPKNFPSFNRVDRLDGRDQKISLTTFKSVYKNAQSKLIAAAQTELDEKKTWSPSDNAVVLMVRNSHQAYFNEVHEMLKNKNEAQLNKEAAALFYNYCGHREKGERAVTLNQIEYNLLMKKWNYVGSYHPDFDYDLEEKKR